MAAISERVDHPGIAGHALLTRSSGGVDVGWLLSESRPCGKGTSRAHIGPCPHTGEPVHEVQSQSGVWRAEIARASSGGES